LAHAFPWEYSYKRLTLAQLLGQLGGFLTWWSAHHGIAPSAAHHDQSPPRHIPKHLDTDPEAYKFQGWPQSCQLTQDFDCEFMLTA
jgi:hypothetical protein